MLGMFAPAQLNMSHALPFAFKKVCGVVERRAKIKPNSRMCAEGVDVGKSRVSDACGGTTIMQELSDV